MPVDSGKPLPNLGGIKQPSGVVLELSEPVRWDWLYLSIGFGHMHADDMQEVVAQRCDEAADEGGIQEEGGWLGCMWHQQVEAEHAQLEDGVVVGCTHVGQWQHHQQLRPHLSQVTSMHCLQM